MLPSHEPPLSRPSATLSPPCGERAGRGVPIWFMVPLHAKKRKEAFHEPSRVRVADPRSGPRLCEAQRFMVPMRAQKRMEALHEPPPHPIPLPLGGGEGARRAGEGVVHGPNACEKRKGAFHEPVGLWRRLAICCVAGCQPAGRSDPFHARRLPIGETADYQSALLDGHG